MVNIFQKCKGQISTYAGLTFTIIILIFKYQGNYKIGVCDEVASFGAPIFPFIETVDGNKRATIGPLSQGMDKMVFGWDSYRNQVINPSRNFELMSYCGPSFTWVSTFTYSLISTYITSNFRRRQLKSQKLRASRKLQNTSYTVIRAIVDMDTNITTFLPSIQVVLPSISAVSSNEYQVVGFNISGKEVFRVAFDPIRSDADIVPSSNSSVEVNSVYVQAFVLTPTTGTIATIRLAQNRSFLGSAQPISGNKPTVTVLFPNGGESLSGSATNISWSATDPDGDALSYSVLFSPDSGTTWKAITTDHTTTSLVVPFNALGQTRFGLIRVQASDGFNIGEDMSDATFVTPNIPPEMQIIRPFNGDNFAGVQLVVLQASSFDVEDGIVAGNRLNWTSGIDGFLGSGLTVEILASSLSENNHTITLKGLDSGGAVTTATVNITVYRIAPPIEDKTTEAPTKSPTAAPIQAPINGPIQAPINGPIQAPINAPIKSPTESPVAECRIGLFNLLCVVRSFFQWLIGRIFRRG
jgi:hypothetical protein